MLDRIKTNKTLLVLIIVITAVLSIIIFRVTYAYLAAESEAAQKNVTLESDVVDELKFINGDALTLNATSGTLQETGSNYEVSSRPKVTLKANSTNNTASYNYYLILQFLDNHFTYTVDSNTPEILLSVTDPSGNAVTEVSGLTYKTINGVSGFDVTTYNGNVTIASQNITSSSSTVATEQEWVVKITYVNLSTNQISNLGNHMIVRTVLATDNDFLYKHCTVGDTLANCLTSNYKYDDNLLYFDSELSYRNPDAEAITNNIRGPKDYSYRFVGATYDVNNYVCFASDAQTCPTDNLYRIIGIFKNTNNNYEVKLIKADYATSTMLGTNGDYDSSTYSASSFDNYAFLGSEAAVNKYHWNTSSGTNTNSWVASELNTVNLNTNYLNYLDNIDSKWSGYIASHDWQVGGNSWDKIVDVWYPDTVYINELVTPAQDVTETAKIGLMYVNEYFTAAESTYWNNKVFFYNGEDIRRGINDNWMYLGLNEWTITSSYNNGTNIYHLNYLGYVRDEVNIGASLAVRPTFYLASTVRYNGGSGEKNNPFRIN